jgi:branched-chain amino acid transport system substrate-binding protein
MPRLAAAGTPITREAMRDAIQSAKVETVQGMVSFDENGDINDRIISLYPFKAGADHSPENQPRFVDVIPAV